MSSKASPTPQIIDYATGEIRIESLSQAPVAGTCVQWDACDKYTGEAVTVLYNVLERKSTLIGADGSPYLKNPANLTTDIIDPDPENSCIPSYREIYEELYPDFFIPIEGPAGAQGPIGLRGETGLLGPEGPEGPEGCEGPRGPRGIAGTPGAPGAPGTSGADSSCVTTTSPGPIPGSSSSEYCVEIWCLQGALAYPVVYGGTTFNSGQELAQHLQLIWDCGVTIDNSGVLACFGCDPGGPIIVDSCTLGGTPPSGGVAGGGSTGSSGGGSTGGTPTGGGGTVSGDRNVDFICNDEIPGVAGNVPSTGCLVWNGTPYSDRAELLDEIGVTYGYATVQATYSTFPGTPSTITLSDPAGEIPGLVPNVISVSCDNIACGGSSSGPIVGASEDRPILCNGTTPPSAGIDDSWNFNNRTYNFFSVQAFEAALEQAYGLTSGLVDGCSVEVNANTMTATFSGQCTVPAYVPVTSCQLGAPPTYDCTFSPGPESCTEAYPVSLSYTLRNCEPYSIVEKTDTIKLRIDGDGVSQLVPNLTSSGNMNYVSHYTRSVVPIGSFVYEHTIDVGMTFTTDGNGNATGYLGWSPPWLDHPGFYTEICLKSTRSGSSSGGIFFQ